MATNLQIARREAELCTYAENDTGRRARPFGQKSSGWFGEDSDFPTSYWRVGGNAAIVWRGDGYEAVRFHDLIRETRYLRYPVR